MFLGHYQIKIKLEYSQWRSTKMETAKEKRLLACKKAKDRIKNGEFLETLREETPKVEKFIQFLHNKRSHAKKTKRRDIPIG